MYRVVVHRRAARYLQRLPRSQRERIQSLLRDLALEPVRSPHVKPMVGEWKGYYRIRVGDVRIVFWVVVIMALYALVYLLGALRST